MLITRRRDVADSGAPLTQATHTSRYSLSLFSESLSLPLSLLSLSSSPSQFTMSYKLLFVPLAYLLCQLRALILDPAGVQSSDRLWHGCH